VTSYVLYHIVNDLDTSSKLTSKYCGDQRKMKTCLQEVHSSQSKERKRWGAKPNPMKQTNKTIKVYRINTKVTTKTSYGNQSYQQPFKEHKARESNLTRGEIDAKTKNRMSQLHKDQNSFGILYINTLFRTSLYIWSSCPLDYCNLLCFWFNLSFCCLLET